MTRAAALLLALATLLAPSAQAQRTGPLIRYGKWVLAEAEKICAADAA